MMAVPSSNFLFLLLTLPFLFLRVADGEKRTPATTPTTITATSTKSGRTPNTVADADTVFSSDDHSYDILSDTVAYDRWRSIVKRKVEMPNGHVVDYDIVDQKGAGAVIIFAWNARTKTATIVKEYNPGCHKILSGLAAGIIETDASKHGSDPDIAARHELEEECHLTGGTWYRLVEEGVSVPMDKYVVTEVVAYLVIDPVKVENPRPLDAEEDIEIVEGVSVPMILDIIRSGGMNLVGGWACMLAIEKLRDLGEI